MSLAMPNRLTGSDKFCVHSRNYCLQNSLTTHRTEITHVGLECPKLSLQDPAQDIFLSIIALGPCELKQCTLYSTHL
jgi:hypothetical protein